MLERTTLPVCHPLAVASESRHQKSSNTSGALLFAGELGILALQNCPRVNILFADRGERFCLVKRVSRINLPLNSQCLLHSCLLLTII